METYLKHRNGTLKVDTENTNHFQTNNTLFKLVESYFCQWIDGAPNDTQEMYNMGLEEYEGETYYSITGAIKDAISALFEYIEDIGLKTMTTKIFYKVDFEGIWEN